MTDDHLRQMDECFKKFDSLTVDRGMLFRQIQSIKNALVYEQCASHAAGRGGVTGSNSAEARHCAVLCSRLNYVDTARKSAAEQIIRASTFSTPRFTKYLAGVLTKCTGSAWLPVRYLLRADTLRHPRVDAYAVIKVDAVKVLPGIFDTLTLLDEGVELPPLDSWVKFRESELSEDVRLHPDYQVIVNMDNIWMFTSHDFISVGVNERFNAFFNLNGVQNKPFLHLGVGEKYVSALQEVGHTQSMQCYSDYSVPVLPAKHPRDIALDALSDLVDKRFRECKMESGEIEKTSDAMMMTV